MGPTVEAGTGERGGGEIDGVQQRESVYPRRRGDDGGGVPKAVSDGPGRIPPSQGPRAQKGWVHVSCLLRQDLCGPHRPRWGRPPLRDPLSRCLG